MTLIELWTIFHINVEWAMTRTGLDMPRDIHTITRTGLDRSRDMQTKAEHQLCKVPEIVHWHRDRLDSCQDAP